MNTTLIAFGKGMPDWVATGFTEYQKRLPKDFSLTLKELKAEERGNASVEAWLAKEAIKLREATPKGAFTVALDERGADLSTTAFAAHIEAWRAHSNDIVFYVGSADGLDAALKAQAHARMRLSSLTLPHMLVRVVLAEQIYRAWSVLNHHPYHRV